MDDTRAGEDRVTTAPAAKPGFLQIDTASAAALAARAQFPEGEGPWEDPNFPIPLGRRSKVLA